jgi:hypothetical protein
MKLNLVIIMFALALLGCGGAKDKAVPSDMAKWDTELKPSIDKLTEEDKKLFLGFVMRAKLGEVFGGKGLEDGLTIGKAIERQKTWVDEQAKKEAEAKLLKQKLEAERAALRKQVDDLLTVTVLNLKLVKESYSENQLIVLGFQNNGQKDILGIKGTVKFIDIFDKEVGAVGFSYDDGLKAGAAGTWNGSRRYNQFIESHKAVANLEEGKYKTRFEPEMIVFSDKTKLIIKD